MPNNLKIPIDVGSQRIRLGRVCNEFQTMMKDNDVAGLGQNQIK
jgi:hypothetical protein